MRLIAVSLLLFFAFQMAKGQQSISIEQVPDHINDSVEICNKVYSTSYLTSQINKPTYLYMVSKDSSVKLSVVIYENVRTQWENPLEDLFLDKKICVKGKLFLYRGKPHIMIRNKDQIQME